MGSKKKNPPPPKPEEDSSEEEAEVEEEEEEEEEVEEEEVDEEEEKEEEKEAHQNKPRPPSSSEGESEEESDEDEDQSTSHPIQPSSQDGKKPSTQRQPTPPPAAVPNSGSEEEETESEDDDDEEDPGLTNEESESPLPTGSAYTVKPITLPADKKGSKPAAKRSLEASKSDIKGSRNSKKAKTGEESDKKGKSVVPPGRIWGEENEIVMLQGMVNYQKQKGSYRSADIGVFHEFIKGKLWEGVTKNQIADKLKRVKGKYLSNMKKVKNGLDPSFSKPHDKKVFDLSKQIWGGEGESNGIEEKTKTKVDNGKGKKVTNDGIENERVEDNAKVKSDNPKGKKGGNDSSVLIPLMDVDEDAKRDLVKDDLKDDGDEDFLSKFPTLYNSFDAETRFLKNNVHLIGIQKARELDEKWKELQIEEMDVLAKRLNMKGELIKLVLDAMKNQ